MTAGDKRKGKEEESISPDSSEVLHSPHSPDEEESSPAKRAKSFATAVDSFLTDDQKRQFELWHQLEAQTKECIKCSVDLRDTKEKIRKGYSRLAGWKVYLQSLEKLHDKLEAEQESHCAELRRLRSLFNDEFYLSGKLGNDGRDLYCCFICCSMLLRQLSLYRDENGVSYFDLFALLNTALDSGFLLAELSSLFFKSERDFRCHIDHHAPCPSADVLHYLESCWKVSSIVWRWDREHETSVLIYNEQRLAELNRLVIDRTSHTPHPKLVALESSEPLLQADQ